MPIIPPSSLPLALMSVQTLHLSTPPSLPSTAPPAQLLQALHDLHAETASSSQRAAAQQLCEQFKRQTPAAALLSTATFLLSSSSLLSSSPPAVSSDVITHFAFHLLEHLIAAHWQALSAADQSGLQAYLLSFLSSLAAAASPPSRLTLHKAPSLLTALIFRSWPQQWPELIPSLSSLSSLHAPTGSLLVALTYQELAEEVINTEASIAEQRRREVQNALIVSMEAVVSSLLSSLQQQQQEQLVLTALAALRALVDWMPGRFVFDTALLPLLLQRLTSPQLYCAVCDVLAVVSNKKYAGIDSREPLLAVWRAALDAVHALLAAPAFAHQLSFLTHTLPLLSNLTRNHLALLSPPPASASASASSPSHSPLVQHFLSTLGALFSHPHPVPSLCALELWVLLFRHNSSSSLLSPSIRPSLIAELLKLCVLKAQKQSSDALSRAEDDGEDRMEQADYLLLFSHYRGVLISLIALMVQLEPLLCFSLALARYEQLLSSASAAQPLDNANRSGYSTTASTRFRELEGMAVILDAMFRAAPSAAFAASALGETAVRLLQLLLSFSTPDPLLHTRRLQALSLFTPVFLHFPATLPLTLSSLLSSVSFRSDREREANASGEELSEDSRACRRRAVHSLILIARKCRRQVAEMLPAVMGGVEAIVRGGEAGDDERLLLMEFVVTVSTGVEKREEQQAFVLRLMAEQLRRWGEDELQQLRAGGRGWTELIGAGNDEVEAVRRVETAGDAATTMRRVKEAVAATRGSRMREELSGIISTFAAVFKAVVKASSEESQPAASSSTSSSPPEPHPASPLLYELLPSCMQLLSSLYSLYSPSALSSLPPTMHGVLAAAESQLQLLRSSSPTTAVSPEQQHAVLLHRFVFASIDTLLSLLSIATRPSPPSLYTAFPQPLFVSLLSHVPYLPPHLLRFLLDRFIAPLLASCPVTQYDTLMEGVLGRTCDAVSRRLQAAWEEVRRRGEGGGGGEQLEIWEENELRECTRAFADAFSRLVHDFELQAGGRPAASRDGSNRLPLSDCAIFSFVFSRAALAACFVSSLLQLLTCPDSPSQSKAVRLLQRCVPLATPHEQLHPLLATAVSLSLQSLAAASSVPSSLSTADLDLIALVTSAYQQMGRQCEAMRRTLRSVAGVREVEVAEVEARLWGETMSDKKYRAAMKLLLTRHVIGSGGAVAVKDLPVRWDRQVGQRLRESEERGAQLETGELPALFQQH